MKSFIKKNIRFIIIVVICITCSVLTTFATDYLFNSNEVYYNNTTSGIQADKVQGAIDELYACASNYAAYNQRLTAVEDYKNQIYPIGSIYISATDSTASAVHDRFGGTWEAYATGRTLIGMGSNGTNNYTTIGATGGASSHTITTDNMPSHTHSFSGTTGSTGGGGSHSHSVSNTSTSRTSGGGGSHSHNFAANVVYASSGAGGYATGTASSFPLKSVTTTTSTISNHTHSYTDYYASTTSGAHTLTVAQMPSHNHSFSGTTEAAGKASDAISALSTIDPYITVYMWKRTA